MKKPVTRKLNNIEKNKIIFVIFFAGLTLAQLALYISLIASKGYAMNSIIFDYYNKSYQDYMTPINVSLLKHPYDAFKYGEFSFYSPLYMLLFKFLSIFSDQELFTKHETSLYVYFSEITLIYVILMAIITAAVAILIYSIKKGNAFIKIWFLFLCLTSAPMLYIYERGNIIPIALFFLFLFLLNYDSEKKYMRHLSLLFLALAVALKPYILVFIILLLREKRFKDSLLEILYCVLLYIIPSFFMGGLSVIGNIISKIPDVISDIWDGGAAYRTDLFGCLDIVAMAMGYEPISNSNPVKYIIWAVLVMLLIICAFISKFKWKRILALTLLVIAAPFAETESSLVLIFIPALYCLDADDERKLMDMIHIGLFVLIMAPMAISDCVIDLSYNTGYEIYLHSFIISISIIIAIIMLSIETLTLKFYGLELNDPKPPKEKKAKDNNKKSEASS